MDNERATCRCRFCGRRFAVLADEYGDHPCECRLSLEAEEAARLAAVEEITNAIEEDEL